MYTMCKLYARAYNEIMLKRLEAEQADFYTENNIDKHELVAHLSNNMCLQYSKYKAKVFRDRNAEILEEQHLNDTIRRLYNGGDKFHPYL
jgi:hypothetical protein